MNLKSVRVAAIYILAAMLFAGVGRDISFAQDQVMKGDQLWAKRDTVENTRGAILMWENAAAARPEDVKLWLKIAYAYYWINELTPESDKKTRQDVCARGLAAAQKALMLDPDNVAANYWTMVIQGRLTEAKGILSGFDFGKAIQRSMFIAHKDDSFHFGGIYRFWGRVIYFIPPKVGWFFKFEMSDSIKNYKKCIEFNPNYLESYLYLAESYLSMKDQDNALKTLERMIAISPDALPQYAPENRFYLGKAKKLLESLK